jgi:hypothetical protein
VGRGQGGGEACSQAVSAATQQHFACMVDDMSLFVNYSLPELCVVPGMLLQMCGVS